MPPVANVGPELPALTEAHSCEAASPLLLPASPPTIVSNTSYNVMGSGQSPDGRDVAGLAMENRNRCDQHSAQRSLRRPVAPQQTGGTHVNGRRRCNRSEAESAVEKLNAAVDESFNHSRVKHVRGP